MLLSVFTMKKKTDRKRLTTNPATLLALDHNQIRTVVGGIGFTATSHELAQLAQKKLKN